MTPPTGGPGVLWAISNDSDFVDLAVVGYSAAQIAGASYSGAPAHYFALNYDAVGHGIGLLDDGGIGVAISEYDEGGDNGGESWLYVPDRDSQSGYIEAGVTPGVNLIRVDSLTNWPDPLAYGARDVAQLTTGDVVLSRGYHAYLTLAQFKGDDDHTGAPCTEPTSPGVLGFDTQAVGDEFWSASEGDTIASVPLASLSTGGSVASSRVLTGANIGAAAPDGVFSLRADASGGIWWTEVTSAEIRYLDAAAIAALTATPSNPTPTRALTSSSFGEAPQYLDIVIDSGGGMWVLTYEAPSRFLYFSAPQLAAGGEQAPEREVTLTINYAVSPRIVGAPVIPPTPAEDFLSPYWFDAGTPATTEITPDIETNVVSGVAPLAVFFDAKGTVADGVTLPYGELAYAWDFDDETGGDWSRGAVENGGDTFSKRLGLGPVEFHTFDEPGTYEVELQVRSPDGLMKSDTVTITVSDPETEFSGTDTVLISTGTDFTRGPGETYTGAAEVTTTTFAGIAAQCTAGKRVLLRRGDTWTDSGFLQITNAGPFQLGVWGDPLDGEATLTGGGNIAVGNDDRDATIAGSTGGLRFTDLYLNGVGIEWQGATADTLFKRITMRNESAICSGSVMNFFGHDIPDGVFFEDCDFEGVPTGSGNNIVFMAAKRQAYVGCRFEDSTEGEHCLRLSTAQRLVIAHCYVAGAPAGRHLLKLHAPDFDTQPNEGAGSPTPGVPNPNLPAGRYSEYVNIHDNVFVNTEGCEWMVHPSPQNDAQNERGRFYIIERNLLQDPNGDAAVMLFHCCVLNSWIRGNAFDRGTGTAMHLGLGQRDSSEADLMALDSCWIANNTHYGPSSTQSIINFRGPFGSGVSWININEKNGLIVRGTVPTDGEFTSADNVITTTPELATDPPVTAADYNLQSDSPAIGQGSGEGAAFWDLFLRPLNWGTGGTVDVGATQYEEP